MNSMKSYVVDGCLLVIEGNCASVEYWSEYLDCWQPFDVSPTSLQFLIDSENLPLVVGERLGWREMGNEHSYFGYFSVAEASHEH